MKILQQPTLATKINDGNNIVFKQTATKKCKFMLMAAIQAPVYEFNSFFRLFSAM